MDDLLSTDACTLPSVERPLRLAEFDALFTDSVRGVEREADRVTLRLVGDADLSRRVRNLAEREAACCTFFTFVVEGSTGEVTLEIRVPPERHDILRALADRAEKLSP